MSSMILIHLEKIKLIKLKQRIQNQQNSSKIISENDRNKRNKHKLCFTNNTNIGEWWMEGGGLMRALTVLYNFMQALQ
jgi:hypothetical protein